MMAVSDQDENANASEPHGAAGNGARLAREMN
jgi:hypothetical protein